MSAQIFNKSVYIIIPAFNEDAIIKRVVEDLLSYSYVVVIIDDGSSRNLLPQLKTLSGFHYIRHKVNLGQGAALQTGIDFAIANGAAYIVTFDADGQHFAADIPAMLSPLQNAEADITLASRFLTGSLHNASVLKQWILKAGRLVNYLFTGLYLSDAHNGLRAMTCAAAKKIQLKENRMAHATEFLFAIRKNKLRYKEVPATVIYTEYSKGKGQSVFNSIRIFFDLALHKLFE
jgi:glycosyltransferase involved in cell wall biosynthesis